jgi:oligopeptide transport system permease protein
MLSFVLRRLLTALPTLFLVIVAAFFMMRAAPGGPFDGERQLPPAIEAAVKAKYGLDQPLPAQFASYIGGVVRGDLGPSLKYKDKTVVDVLKENYGVSVTLGLSALIVGSIVGVTLGVVAALRQNRPGDYAVMAVAVLGVCIPTFVTAPLLVLVFASTLGWLPNAGWNNGALANLILPVGVLALPQIAIVSRLVRAGMIESLRSNFVRTARAKGLPGWQVVTRHALPPALMPLISYLGPACAGLMTGSLVVERIFGLPGLGKFFVISALQRDYTVVIGMVIVYAALILLLNLAADLLAAAVDPRVRLS